MTVEKRNEKNMVKNTYDNEYNGEEEQEREGEIQRERVIRAIPIKNNMRKRKTKGQCIQYVF